MLLFQTQTGAQAAQKKNQDGSFGNVVQEVFDRVVNRIAGVSPPKENKQPEGKQPYFMMPSKGEAAQKNAPAGASPDLERVAAKFNDLSNKDLDKADQVLTAAIKKAERDAGPAPSGNDTLASIKREEKIQGFMIKKLEEEIGKA